MTVTHEHAVEVDTRLAELWNAEQKQHGEVAAAISSLKYGVETPDERWNSRSLKAEEIERRARAAVESSTLHGRTLQPWTLEGIEKSLRRMDTARVEILRLRAEAQPFEAEYATERWNRFFLVQNTNGHIHSSMHCGTCRWDTRYAWLPTLSGLGEDAAVEQEGPRLCSVCFPSAPLEWTLGLPKALNPKRCDGSGQRALEPNYRYHTPSGKCPTCGDVFAVSRSTGKVRAHNKKAA